MYLNLDGWYFNMLFYLRALVYSVEYFALNSLPCSSPYRREERGAFGHVVVASHV